MWIYVPHNSKTRVDLGEISNKNLLRAGLVRLVYKFAKSVRKTNRKVQEFKTYNKIISNHIYRNK